MRKEQIEREMEKAYEQYFSTLAKKEGGGRTLYTGPRNAEQEKEEMWERMTNPHLFGESKGAYRKTKVRSENDLAFGFSIPTLGCHTLRGGSEGNSAERDQDQAEEGEDGQQGARLRQGEVQGQGRQAQAGLQGVQGQVGRGPVCGGVDILL